MDGSRELHRRLSRMIIPPQISFNFEEIRAELAQKLQIYQNMVVTESGAKEAKVDRDKPKQV